MDNHKRLRVHIWGEKDRGKKVGGNGPGLVFVFEKVSTVQGFRAQSTTLKHQKIK